MGAFCSFFLPSSKLVETSSGARILPLLLALSPALLAIPTAYFISF